MTRRYRRIGLSTSDELGAVAVGVLVGAGAAAVSYYLTRLWLARDPIGTDSDDAPLPAPTTSPRLPPGDTARAD